MFYLILKRHLFLAAAGMVVLGVVITTQTANWMMEGNSIEIAIMVDLAILLPALYLWLHRPLQKTVVLKSLAIGCAGIWLTGLLIPSQHQSLLPSFAWLRYIGIAILGYIEIRVFLIIYRAVLAQASPAEKYTEELAAATGIPKRFIELIVKEAIFWKVLMLKLRVFFRRK
jgi:hypothetical protein